MSSERRQARRAARRELAKLVGEQRADQLSPAEQNEVIADGVRIIDPGEQERQARIERARAEAAAERRARTIGRKQFDAMSQSQKDAWIRDGGLVKD